MIESRPRELPSLAEVMPHAGEILLLKELVEHAEHATSCRIEIDSDGWLQRANGAVPGWIAVEYMAQCIAAHEGYRAWLESRPVRRGILGRARSLRIDRAFFEPGEELLVRAQRVRGRPELRALSYACQLRSSADPSNNPLAEGTITVAFPAQPFGRERLPS